MKPILFNSEMVQGILDDRKGVTRRIFKGNIPPEPVFGFSCFTPKGHISCRGNFKSREPGEKFYKKPYQVGDVLYVREAAMIQSMKMLGRKVKMLFKADQKLIEFTVSQKEYARLLNYEHKKIYLSPYWQTKETARLFLKVTDVRVERLQDITIEQCKKEGAIDILLDVKHPLQPKISEFAEWIESSNDWFVGPKDAFAALWNSTIDKTDLERYGWDANPFVWVIEFERCEKEVE